MTISTNVEKVRLLIGDRDSSSYLLTDEEINYFVDLNSDNIYYSAIDCCRAIIAEYARNVDFTMGKTKISQSQMIEHYEKVIDGIRAMVAIDSDSLYVGYIYKDEIDTDHEDDDLIQPEFEVGMHDYDENKDDDTSVDSHD